MLQLSTKKRDRPLSELHLHLCSSLLHADPRDARAGEGDGHRITVGLGGHNPPHGRLSSCENPRPEDAWLSMDSGWTWERFRGCRRRKRARSARRTSPVKKVKA